MPPAQDSPRIRRSEAGPAHRSAQRSRLCEPFRQGSPAGSAGGSGSGGLPFAHLTRSYPVRALFGTRRFADRVFADARKDRGGRIGPVSALSLRGACRFPIITVMRAAFGPVRSMAGPIRLVFVRVREASFIGFDATLFEYTDRLRAFLPPHRPYGHLTAAKPSCGDCRTKTLRPFPEDHIRQFPNGPTVHPIPITSLRPAPAFP